MDGTHPYPRFEGGVCRASALSCRSILKPFGQIEVLGARSEDAPKLSNLVQGRPSDLALASVEFSVFHRCAALNAPVEASGAGLIHVAPVMPFCGQTIAEVEKLTLETLRPYGYKAVPLSLNALSPRTAALIVSIGFNRRSSRENKDGPSCRKYSSSKLFAGRSGAVSTRT